MSTSDITDLLNSQNDDIFNIEQAGNDNSDWKLQLESVGSCVGLPPCHNNHILHKGFMAFTDPDYTDLSIITWKHKHFCTQEK